jgi:predicted metal-dependent hydrolase
MKIPKKEIDKLVNREKAWISKKLEEAVKINAEKKNFKITEGDLLRLAGGKYPLMKGRYDGFDGKAFYITDDCEKVQKSLADIYRSTAKEVLTKRANLLSETTGLKFNSVKISGAKTRWGSCSCKNKINFSWRLIMAPLDVIDYVVVHELAHTVQHNHSKNFWNIVARFVPDYKEKRKELKVLAKALKQENWDIF